MANSRNQPKKMESNYTYGFFAGIAVSLFGTNVLQENAADKNRSLRNFQIEYQAHQSVLRKSPLPEHELESFNERLAKVRNASVAQLDRIHVRTHRTGLGLLFTGSATAAYCTYQNVGRLLDSGNEQTVKASPRP